MAIAVGAVAYLLAGTGTFGTPLSAATILFFISALDDRNGLPTLIRFAAHMAMAIMVAAVWIADSPMAENAGHAYGGWLLSPAGIILMVVTLCWMSNLFNFMDGANGMAGGMAAVGFAAYSIGANATSATSGLHADMVAITASLCGAAIGFLLFNFPKARVFMGDAGSIPLGFLAAALGIHGTLAGLWEWWFGPMVFSPFIIDATATLIKRVAQGKNIWQAHREHYYQRLILSGWSHTKTVLAYYFLMLGSAISALISQGSELVRPIALFWVITYALLIFSLEWRFHQDKNDKTKKHPGAK